METGEALTWRSMERSSSWSLARLLISAESMAMGFGAGGAGEGADPDAALCPPLPPPPPESMAAVLGFESSHSDSKSEVFGFGRGAARFRAQSSLKKKICLSCCKIGDIRSILFLLLQLIFMLNLIVYLIKK
jgi:hypothetical protein